MGVPFKSEIYTIKTKWQQKRRKKKSHIMIRLRDFGRIKNEKD